MKVTIRVEVQAHLSEHVPDADLERIVDGIRRQVHVQIETVAAQLRRKRLADGTEALLVSFVPQEPGSGDKPRIITPPPGLSVVRP